MKGLNRLAASVFVLFAGYITITAFTMVSLITGIISEALISAQLRDDA